MEYLITYSPGLGRFYLKTLRADSPEEALDIFQKWTQTPQAVDMNEQRSFVETIHEIGPIVYGEGK